MKTLISDHDYELHLGSTAKPGIQKLWIAVISEPVWSPTIAQRSG
jgi:hypothetical protein